MSYTFTVDETRDVYVTHESGERYRLHAWTWHAGAMRQLIGERDALLARVAELEKVK